MLQKIDFIKEFKNLYSASVKTPSIIEVPKMNFLKIDGKGNPAGQEFQDAAGAVYPVAYTIKFMIRDILNIDYKVMPMEVLWTVNRDKKEFLWTMMLMQPHFVTKEIFDEAYKKVKEKFNPLLLSKVRFESMNEGTCVQMLHKGAYDKMNDTLEKMLIFVKEKGYKSERDTHDIYFNDVRKTKPENLKTIMRLKVEKS